MKTKKKPIRCFLIAIISIYFLFFWDAGNQNHIRIPPWVFEDNCRNPKIIALVTRDMTGRNGPLLSRAYDLLFTIITSNQYFSTQKFLTIIDLNNNRIVYEIPDIDLESLLLSNDGRWLLYVANDSLYLNALDKGVQKPISQNVDIKLLDWTGDRNSILIEENNKIELADISECLNISTGNCVIRKQIIINHENSCSPVVNYGRIISKDLILIKYIGENANIINLKGKTLKEIPDKDCSGVEFDPVNKEYIFSCGHSIKIYSSSFELKSISNFDYEIYGVKRLLDGHSMIFESGDDMWEYHLFDGMTERSFYPTRLYIMDENDQVSIKPIYKRTDEHIGWTGLPGRDENCSLSQ